VKKLAKKKNKNHYFTKVHENAIVEYATTKDIKVRTTLYIQYIGPAFNELVDKITYTYKFTNLPNIDSLKNWFIHKVKKNATRYRREIHYEDLNKDVEFEHMTVDNEYYSTRTEHEFWKHLHTEINSWDTENLKPNEKKVLDAIKILFENSEDIEIFNKKAIYLYIREITGLNTKQVVCNLNKMRSKYREFKHKWDNET
jgi:hypothetical protein